MEERGHILEILKKVQKAIINKDYVKLKFLSDETILHASIHQDSDTVSLAVIIYSLSKLIEREHYLEDNWYKFFKEYKKNISNMIKALEKDNDELFRDEVKANSVLIEKLSGGLRDFIGDVFRKAKINKASKMYDKGISLERTANILGISLWELQEYSGTRMSDNNLNVTMSIKERIKLAEEIFK
ncbi:hypothetical protein J4221_07040 [Candidatus Pacearchaeota archaeon]|nr:hypothetical protein [Candidatus Pacearchaeota archaeon]